MSGKAIAAALIGLSFLFLGGVSRADDASNQTQFKFDTANNAQPEVALNDELAIQIVSKEMPLDVEKTALYIDNLPLGISPRVDLVNKTLTFPLQRTSGNQAMWTHLLGSPFSHEMIRELPITLQLNDKSMQFVNNVPSDKHPIAKIALVTYHKGLMTFGILLSALVILCTVLMCRYTTMIRDSSIPQLSRKDRPFSLGRFQMTFWFCLIFASFVFIGLVTFDINSITPQSFVLLGISAATALGSVAVDQTKDSKVQIIQDSVTALGISTADDTDALAAAYAAQPDGPANAVIHDAVIGTNLTPTVRQLWTEYRDRIRDVKSDNFVRDLVNDINGPTIHRWQILIWTLVFGGIYAYSVYANLVTPNFSDNLLALMGISGATYIGFKIPEKQSP